MAGAAATAHVEELGCGHRIVLLEAVGGQGTDFRRRRHEDRGRCGGADRRAVIRLWRSLGRGGRCWRRVGRIAIIDTNLQAPAVEIAAGITHIVAPRFVGVSHVERPVTIAGLALEPCKAIAAGAEGATGEGEGWFQPCHGVVINRELTVAAATPGVEVVVIKGKEIRCGAIGCAQAKGEPVESTMIEGEIVEADVGHRAVDRDIDCRANRRQIIDGFGDVTAGVDAATPIVGHRRWRGRRADLHADFVGQILRGIALWRRDAQFEVTGAVDDEVEIFVELEGANTGHVSENAHVGHQRA